MYFQGVLPIFKKKVNLGLLLLIVVLLLIYSMFSVHYNQALSNFTRYYGNNSIKSASGNVILEQNNSSSLLQKDKHDLEKKYFDIKTENDKLKNVNSELQNLQEQFDKLKNRFSEVQDALVKANNGISLLIGRNNELCRELKEAGGKDEKCK